MEQSDAFVQDIENADFVLIGIGSGMQVKLQTLKETDRFARKYAAAEKEKSWLIPFLIRYYLKEQYHPKIIRAYQALERLLRDKNYFVVSLSTDDLIRKSGLKKDRMVLPCGTYELLQCEEDCQGKLFQMEPCEWAGIYGWVEDRIAMEELEEPVCPDCGAPLVMNQYGQKKYNESAYLKDWDRYTKWLQGTVGKKLCIAELGVGMEFPSVIRWPFEKTCFYNQKARFWRIHGSLYQLPEELRERGVSVKESPIDFLGRLQSDDRKDMKR